MRLSIPRLPKTLLVLPVAAVLVTLVIGSCVPPNHAPTADAGDDQTVTGGAVVTLDGSNSRDPDDNSLTFSWSQVSGPSVELANASASTATFTAPSTGALLVFELTVDDSREQAAERTNVSVLPLADDGQIIEHNQPSVHDDPAVSGNFPENWKLDTALVGEAEEGEGGAPGWIEQTIYAPDAELDLAPRASHTVELQLSGASILMGSVRWIGATDPLGVAFALDGKALDDGEPFTLGNDRGGQIMSVQTTGGGRATLKVTNTTGSKIHVRINLGAFAL